MKKKIALLTVTVFMLHASGCAAQNEPVSIPLPEISATQPISSSETSVESVLAEQENRTQYPLTISNFNFARDSIGITFEKPPERVLAVYQNSIETLLALGLEHKILAAAGLDHEVKPEYAAQFSTVNYLTEFAPDKETVIMMQPDFIVSWHSFFGENRLGEVDYWHENDINTYMKLNSGAIQHSRVLHNEYEDILNMGKIFDVQDRAEAIVDEIQNEIASVVAHANIMEENPSVLVIEFLGDNIRVYGETTLPGDMVIQLAADLITIEGNSIGQEDLIALDPDVIFVIYMDQDNEDMAQTSVGKVLDEPKFASLQAVQGGKVHAIPLGEVFCSGVRTIDGIRNFASGIYGER